MVEIAFSTLRHLGFGLRTMLFMRVDPARMRVAGAEPVVLGLAMIAAEGCYEALSAEVITLSAAGLGGKLGAIAFTLALLLLLSGRRRYGDLASLLSVVFAINIWFSLIVIAAMVAWAAVTSNPQTAAILGPAGIVWLAFAPMAAGFGVIAWFILAMGVLGARSAQGRPYLAGPLLAAACVLPALLMPLSPLVPGPDDSDASLLQTVFDRVQLRTRAERPAPPRAKPLDIEAIYARQPQLIDAALEAIPPSRPSRSEVYFVGMATYSEQDVFKREISSARAIVDQRFSTGGRSVLMINHRETTDTLPLANATNLERILWRLAQVMDREKDILVLFVTTHGNDGLLAVTFPRFAMNDLTPDKLAGVLERTGIKNRVVILSACHVGSLIPALTGPDTLVMAAARADRSSFGCSNERDWTYFGDALFNHALRETRSFPAAFDRAKALIATWENDQKLSPPSEPQIATGERIAARLETLARELDGQAKPAVTE
jgi:Peptidase C13 family